MQPIKTKPSTGQETQVKISGGQDHLPNIPRYVNPLFDINTLHQEAKDVALKLAKDGFAIIRFPDKEINTICHSIISDLDGHFDFDKKIKNPSLSLRAQDYLEIDGIKKIANNRSVIETLSNVFGKEAFPFQTLNFPMGTQQESHSDHIHFDSIPNGYMAGVWVALEDIGADQGPLFYYPGSHLWPRLDNLTIGYDQKESSAPHYPQYPKLWDKLAEKNGVARQIFTAKRGDCFIWAPNLVHGGSEQTDYSKTRWSQVTHYFFKDCAYYTPVLSNEVFNKIHWRKPKNIIDGSLVTPMIFGRSLTEYQQDYSDFDPQKYLLLNKDVEKAGVNPFQHFVLHGIREGRSYK